MDKEGCAMFAWLGCLIVVCILACFIPFFVCIYPEGIAHARWLKETKGIEMPWWQAAFIPINTSNSDVQLRYQNGIDNNEAGGPRHADTK